MLEPETTDNEPMDEIELQSIVDSEIRNATGWLADEIVDDREEALEYYYGNKPEIAEEGRSSVVSTDVRDVVEHIMPSLMRVFMAGGDAVEFTPKGPGDEDAAIQETKAVNHQFFDISRGYEILHEWFKDALLQKNGYVKCYWSNETDVTQETYEGLTDMGLAQMLADPEVEPIEHETHEIPGPMGVMASHSLRIKRRKVNGSLKIETVPPEEILVSRRARSIYPNDAPFFAHRTRKTKTDLVEMGFDPAQIEKLLPDDNQEFWTDEEFVRQEQTSSWFQTEDGAESFYWITECFMSVDLDGDDIAEKVCVTVGGSTNEILRVEHVDRTPFACITPIMMSHSHYGLSMYDITRDLQDIKTSIWRQSLNNLYLVNEPRKEVVTNQVNLDDLLTSRPGGIVRTKAPGMIRDLTVPFVAGQSFPMIEYADQVMARRTGFSDTTQGLDPNVLQNATAGAIAAAMSAAQMRVEMIARTFAETGVKDLFLQIHELLRKHEDKELHMKLGGEWTPVSPTEWKDRTDMSINVGLGTGNAQERLAAVAAIQNTQDKLVAQGAMGTLLTPEHIYNANQEMVKLAGYKSADRFFLDPKFAEPKPPPPPPESLLLAEAQKQIEMMKAGQREQEASMKAELEVMKAQLQHIQAMTKLEVENSVDVPGSAV